MSVARGSTGTAHRFVLFTGGPTDSVFHTDSASGSSDFGYNVRQKPEAATMPEQSEGKPSPDSRVAACFWNICLQTGAGGVDGMSVDQLATYMAENYAEIKRSILTKEYRPQPVIRVEIPKPNEGVSLVLVLYREYQRVRVEVFVVAHVYLTLIFQCSSTECNSDITKSDIIQHVKNPLGCLRACLDLA